MRAPLLVASLFSVALFDAASAETVRARQFPMAAQDGVYSVTYVRGRDLLLTRASNTDGVSRLQLIETTTGKVALDLTGPAADEVFVLAPRDDDDTPVAVVRVVATGDASAPQRRLFDVVAGREITELAREEEPRLVVGSGRELRIVTEQVVTAPDRSASLRLRIVPLTGGAGSHVDIPGEVAETRSVDARVRASKDGRQLAVIRDGVLHVVDVATGTIRTIPRPEGTYHTGADFSDDGRMIYAARGIGGIRVVDAATLAETRSIADFGRGSLFTFNERAGGKVLEIGGRRLTIFHDVGSGRDLWHARGSSVNSYRLSWLATGHVLRASRSRSSPITYGVYRHHSGGFEQLYKREWVGGRLGALVVSPNGRCMLLSSAARTALLAPVSGKEIATVSGLAGALEHAAMAPDGREIIATGANGALWRMTLPSVCATTDGEPKAPR